MAHEHTWRTLTLTAIVMATAAAASGCSTSHPGSEVDAATGSDATPPEPDAAEPDAAELRDAGTDALVMPGSCQAMDARAIVCPPLACDGPPTFFWDGSQCFPIGCGECEGADCEAGEASLSECMESHLHCEAAVCRATGGDWLSALLYCGHHVCGRPGLAICESPTPACNCGATRTFTAAGCVDDPSCAPPDPSVDPESLCTSSGGTWESVCCPSTCGVPCAAECLAPACTCGALQVWDPLLGCIDSSTCMERAAGEACDENRLCDGGLVCCQRCTGVGCDPERTCAAPLCDAGPGVDVCGNDVLAPCAMRPAIDHLGDGCSPRGPACPPGYVCQAFNGAALTHSCQIPCEPGGCACPSGTMCNEHTDKATSWHQCDEVDT